MSAIEPLLHAPALVAAGAARPGTAADAVDGTVPRLVVQPASGERLAAVLAWASAERLATIIQGGGTKRRWGRIPDGIDLLIQTSRLVEPVVHRDGDLTATAPAGVRIQELNDTLRRAGQWLPIDVADDRSTVGGTLASNAAGPLRHRHGTPRDLLIGITIATGDGRLVRSGGHVVKNVAGYDLGKLLCGSFGAMAAIVDATFKLIPLPAASRTVVARFHATDALARAVQALSGSQLEPTASDARILLGGGRRSFELLVRFASSEGAVMSQAATAAALVGGNSEIVTGEVETVLWRSQSEAAVVSSMATAGQTSAVVRLSWLPTQLAELASLMERLEELNLTIDFAGRVAVGAGFLRITGDEAAVAASVGRLREAVTVAGHVVVIDASPSLKSRVDVWGPPAGSARIADGLKRTFDPAGILGAGRGPV